MVNNELDIEGKGESKLDFNIRSMSDVNDIKHSSVNKGNEEVIIHAKTMSIRNSNVDKDSKKVAGSTAIVTVVAQFDGDKLNVDESESDGSDSHDLDIQDIHKHMITKGMNTSGSDKNVEMNDASKEQSHVSGAESSDAHSNPDDEFVEEVYGITIGNVVGPHDMDDETPQHPKKDNNKKDDQILENVWTEVNSDKQSNDDNIFKC